MTSEQSKDAGLALVLICLLICYFGQYYQLLPLAIVLLVLTMTAPKLFTPFARVWFGLSHLLGAVMSRVLLTLLFYVMVVPVGLARRAMGKDAMQLKKWRTGNDTVFRKREQIVTAKDLSKPY